MKALRTRLAEPVQRGFNLAGRTGHDRASHILEDMTAPALRPGNIQNNNWPVHWPFHIYETETTRLSPLLESFQRVTTFFR